MSITRFSNVRFAITDIIYNQKGTNRMDQETLAWLKKHGPEIGAFSAQGDMLCRRIISLYTLYRNWTADKAALVLLKESIEEYKARYKPDTIPLPTWDELTQD